MIQEHLLHLDEIDDMISLSRHIRTRPERQINNQKMTQTPKTHKTRARQKNFLTSADPLVAQSNTGETENN
ncbi:hypothetical protein VTN00DRAFT_1257 [Thermoascus crustaceus]|uniref:uncharacterized protein n=1 Tax=Thermoascus crustaceus TaxID=5088 RepID=UPI0037440B3D